MSLNHKAITASLTSVLLVESALTLQNNQGQFYPLGDSLQCLEPFLVVITKKILAQNVNNVKVDKPTVGNLMLPSVMCKCNE